jgi:hypothetical protein
MNSTGVIRVGRRRRLVGVAVTVAALAFASVAVAKQHSSIKLSGSHTNHIGQSFSIKMSGFAASPANDVVAGEQTSISSPCAKSYSSEKGRSDYFPAFAQAVHKNKRFKNLAAPFSAQVPGTHALCAYVISSKTFKTYAHAEFKWTNKPSTPTGGTLKPAPVGSGQCPAQAYSDGSVTAQIAVSNATCTTALMVEAGADTARGAPYSSDGFSCAATTEGSGSPWSSAWGGTYYAYSCADGSAQVAFNWGTDYTY